MRSELRKKEILKRMAELYLQGVSYNEIGKIIEQEFGIKKPSADTIKAILIEYQMRKNALLQTDEELKEFYKRSVQEEIEIWKEQLRKINYIANELLDYCRRLALRQMELGEKIDRELIQEMLASMDRILLQIKVATDILQRIESTSKELKISIIEIIDKSKEVLKELERKGYIKIVRKLDDVNLEDLK